MLAWIADDQPAERLQKASGNIGITASLTFDVVTRYSPIFYRRSGFYKQSGSLLVDLLPAGEGNRLTQSGSEH